MRSTTLDRLKQTVLEAGLEIYRASADEIRIAERARMHLMDSGVSVLKHDGTVISLTIRSQRSDFPAEQPAELFEKIRAATRESLEARGFQEQKAVSREVTDPVDETHVLDLWHELTFTKSISDESTLIADLHWALTIPKCIT